MLRKLFNWLFPKKIAPDLRIEVQLAKDPYFMYNKKVYKDGPFSWKEATQPYVRKENE